MKTINTADLLDLYSRFIKASVSKLPDLEWSLDFNAEQGTVSEVMLTNFTGFQNHLYVVAKLYVPLPAEGESILPGDYWHIQWNQNMEKWLSVHPELKAILEPHFTGTFK